MKINLDNSENDLRIEIIPLIDVIFCILTFFIVATLQFTRQQALNLDLPTARTAQAQIRQQQPLLVSVDLIGQTYIDKQPVTVERLQQEIQGYLRQNPSGTVLLYAAKATSYNDVIRVLDLLRSVGGDRVSLGTLPAGVSPATTTPTAPSRDTNPSGWSLPNQNNLQQPAQSGTAPSVSPPPDQSASPGVNSPSPFTTNPN
jgi:biopolymer transport protein ExbD